jgi:UDP-2,3-diacylglucosamine hydrolase
MGIANYFSRKSRAQAGTSDEEFLGEDKEWLIIYCKEILQKQHYDFFVFGHRHLPINFNLPQSSLYIKLGDWIKYDSYAVFDGVNLELKYYTPIP